MEITFSAANAVGLNNPGTEIITLVKDGSGNFINPPSYDKMRAYLSSGEVPMLFVTAEGGETGSLYQLVEYSETENKIRFSNDTNAIEFCAGCEVPNVVEISSGGGSADFVINGTINSNMEVTLDKTFAQIQAAIQDGKHPAVHLTGMEGDDFLPIVFSSADGVAFAAVSDVSEGTISSTGIWMTADTIIFNHSPSPIYHFIPNYHILPYQILTVKLYQTLARPPTSSAHTTRLSSCPPVLSAYTPAAAAQVKILGNRKARECSRALSSVMLPLLHL